MPPIWEFIRECFIREEAARRQGRDLEVQLSSLQTKLQQAIQKEQLAVNGLQARSNQYQMTLTQNESTKIQLDKQLNEERHLRKVTADALRVEQASRVDSQRFLDAVWESHVRLASLLSSLQLLSWPVAEKSGNRAPKAFEPRDLILNDDAKKQAIDSLEHAMHRHIADLNERLEAEQGQCRMELATRDCRIGELEKLVAGYDDHVEEQGPAEPCRKRRRSKSSYLTAKEVNLSLN